MSHRLHPPSQLGRTLSNIRSDPRRGVGVGTLDGTPCAPEALQLTMVVEHVSRHLMKTVRQKPLVCAAVAATSALVAYLIWAEKEEEEEALARVRSLSDVYPGALQAPKSFTVTNERGELRGQVDETASSWSWFVEEEQWALALEHAAMATWHRVPKPRAQP